jgi:hypothetical protein
LTTGPSDDDEPNAKLVELSELLVGTWRVEGPDILQARYMDTMGDEATYTWVEAHGVRTDHSRREGEFNP